MEDIRFTKKILLHRVNNDMTSNYYYLVYFRVNNIKLKKVVIVFDDDIFEFYEKDNVTQTELKTATNEIIYSNLEQYENMNIIDIIKDCNNTILDYNRG